jgi:hypothetical protein
LWEAGLAELTLKQLADNLADAGSATGFSLKLRKLMAAMAIEGQSYSQRNYGKNGLGVVTGNLKRSIVGKAFHSGDGVGIVLTAGDNGLVTYAAKHEFGEGVPPRPYVRPAIDHLRNVIPPHIERAFVSSVLGRGFKP